MKEKASNAVFFDAGHYEKLLSATAVMKLITVSSLIDKLKINGYLINNFVKLIIHS